MIRKSLTYKTAIGIGSTPIPAPQGVGKRYSMCGLLTRGNARGGDRQEKGTVYGVPDVVTC